MANPVKKPDPKPAPLRVIAKGCNLLDPTTMLRFPDGVIVEVESDKISPWLHLQMKAGLVRRM